MFSFFQRKRKHVDECSIEELEEELRVRKKRAPADSPSISKCKKDITIQINPVVAADAAATATAKDDNNDDDDDELPVKYFPDADSLDIFTAHQKLSRIFQETMDHVRRRGNSSSNSNTTSNYQFPLDHCLFLIRTHPSLISKGFHGRTTLAFFLMAKVNLETCRFLCRLWTYYMPAAPGASSTKKKLSITSSSSNAAATNNYLFADRQPNPVVDCCVYGAGARPGVLKYIIQQFPRDIMRRDPAGKLPLEVLLERYLPERNNDNDNNNSSNANNNNANNNPMLKPPLLRLPQVLEIVDTMLKSCPKMLEECSDDYLAELVDDSSLAPTNIQEFIFHKFARRTTLSLDLKKLKAPTVPIISRVLPKLTYFYWTEPTIDTNMYRYLLSLLYRLKKPALDYVGLPVFKHLPYDDEFKHMLEEFVKKCKELNELSLCASDITDHASFSHLRFTNSDDRNEDKILRLCGNIIQSNRKIEKAQLARFRLSDATCLSEVISKLSSKLKLLDLDQIEIPAESEWSPCRFEEATPTTTTEPAAAAQAASSPSSSSLKSPSSSVCHAATATTSIETLKIQKVDMHSCWVKGLLSQLKDIPKLKTLYLKHKTEGDVSSNPDITEALVEVLKVNSLEDASIFECTVQLDVLAQALVHNKSLLTLELSYIVNDSHVKCIADVLQEQNMALSVMKVNRGEFADTLQGKRILYYSTLNNFKRAGLLDSRKPSLEDVVEILCHVAEDEDLDGALMLRHSVQYGILHQSPALWAIDVIARPDVV